ncbi:MAG: hypothetical protein ACI4GW_09140 [Lachnospiraceae bacterium]
MTVLIVVLYMKIEENIKELIDDLVPINYKNEFRIGLEMEKYIIENAVRLNL